MRIIDLSLPINNDMQGIPMLPEYVENPTRCIALATMSDEQQAGLVERGVRIADNAEVTLHMMSRLEIVTHIGTHIDAPCHFLDGDRWSIDQVPMELMCKKGRVIPLTDTPPTSPVTADAILATGVEIDNSVIPILHTGWTDKTWGTDRFWGEMPYLDTTAAELMVERGVSAVAMDFFPEAPFWLGIEADAPPGRNHKTLLGNKTIILQMLTNIGGIDTDDFTLFGVPLKLEALDGSPARIFAMVNE